MASIKVNYTTGNKRTSTTFSEITARFFIQAWHSMQKLKQLDANSWTILDKNDMFYRDLSEVKTEFQACINHMIQYYDYLYKNDMNTLQPWSKDEIEYHVLLNIYQFEPGIRLKGD